MKKFLALFFATIFFVSAAGFVFAQNPPTGDRMLTGYAWSSNVGWLSFNCANTGGCLGTSKYKVKVSDAGALSGYAWSSNIGWVQVGGLSGFPSGVGTVSSNATLAQSGNVSGWIRALAIGGGWDGWISLKGDTKEGPAPAAPSSQTVSETVVDNTTVVKKLGSDVDAQCPVGYVVSGRTQNFDGSITCRKWISTNVTVDLNNIQTVLTGDGDVQAKCPANYVQTGFKSGTYGGSGEVNEWITCAKLSGGSVSNYSSAPFVWHGEDCSTTYGKDSVSIGQWRGTTVNRGTYCGKITRTTTTPSSPAAPYSAGSYGVKLSGNNFSGFAWGGDVVGWLSFSGPGYGVSIVPNDPATDPVDLNAPHCVGPDGFIIPYGASRVYYKAATVPDGELCNDSNNSESRLCTGSTTAPTLSGSYTFSSCSDGSTPGVIPGEPIVVAPKVTLSIAGASGSFSHGPVLINKGTSVRVKWDTSAGGIPDSCVGSGGLSGDLAVEGGEVSFTPTTSQTYRITCSNVMGESTDTVRAVILNINEF